MKFGKSQAGFVSDLRHLLLQSMGALPLQVAHPEVTLSDHLGLRCDCRAQVTVEVVFLTPPQASLAATCRGCGAAWIWGHP